MIRIHEELFESKPAEFSNLETELYKYTDGFNNAGAYPVDSGKEAKEAKDILTKYYNKVYVRIDMSDANDPDGCFYRVRFEDPKHEDVDADIDLAEMLESDDIESLYEKKKKEKEDLIFRKELFPVKGPMSNPNGVAPGEVGNLG